MLMMWQSFLQSCRSGKAAKRLMESRLETPEHIPPPEEYQQDSNGLLQAIVFIIGFCCCPAWCLGWIWINSKRPSSRRFARASVVLSILAIIGLILVVVFVTAGEPVPSDMEHCKSMDACLVSMRLAGPAANLDFMSGPSRQEYDGQFNFKRAVHNIVLRHVSDKARKIEESVLIDHLEELKSQV
jgi:hypothetical protein